MRKALVLELDHGVMDGKQVVKNKTFSNINEAAPDQDLYDVSEALMSLQEHSLLQVKKVETRALINN